MRFTIFEYNKNVKQKINRLVIVIITKAENDKLKKQPLIILFWNILKFQDTMAKKNAK